MKPMRLFIIIMALFFIFMLSSCTTTEEERNHDGLGELIREGYPTEINCFQILKETASEGFG